MQPLNFSPLDKLKPKPISFVNIVVGTIFFVIAFLWSGLYALINQLAAIWVVIWVLIIGGLIFGSLIYATLHRRKTLQDFGKVNNLPSLNRQKLRDLRPLSFKKGPPISWLSGPIGGHTVTINKRPVAIYQYVFAERGTKPTYGTAVFKTEKSFPHIYIHTNRRTAKYVRPYKTKQKLNVEGIDNEVFSFYARSKSDLDTISPAIPDITTAVSAHDNLFDIEIYGNTVSVFSPFISIYTEDGVKQFSEMLDVLLSNPLFGGETSITQTKDSPPTLVKKFMWWL